MKKCLALISILSFIILTSCFPYSAKQYDLWYSKQIPWLADKSAKGKGYADIQFDDRGRAYAWGWSYYGISLINMYEATGNKKYLNEFVPQANFILSQRNSKLGIPSFTGKNKALPVWSENGYYSKDKNFVYTFPVHTSLIVLPMLMFAEVVEKNHLSQYQKEANFYIKQAGKALMADPLVFKRTGKNEGYYWENSFGKGEIIVAGRQSMPNRVNIYMAACGLFDKLNHSHRYTKQIKMSLRYFKDHMLLYDKKHNSYYWYYWPSYHPPHFEDISHGALTVYGLYLLHYDMGYHVFSDQDFQRFANTAKNLIQANHNSVKVAKNIHPQGNYFTYQNNSLYQSILNWAFLAEVDPSLKSLFKKTYDIIYRDGKLSKKTQATRLFQLSLLIKAK